jgi:hypothetical protein
MLRPERLFIHVALVHTEENTDLVVAKSLNPLIDDKIQCSVCLKLFTKLQFGVHMYNCTQYIM